MNSLEKLIKDLEDSRDIVFEQTEVIHENQHPLGAMDGVVNQLIFVRQTIQAAINRLKALNEEEGLSE